MRTRRKAAKPRLVYLAKSEAPVKWAWDGFDDKRGFVYATYRWGVLIVSHDGRKILERKVGGDEDESISRADLLKQLDGYFDTALFENGTICDCGHAYERKMEPEHCYHCGENPCREGLLKTIKPKGPIRQALRHVLH